MKTSAKWAVGVAALIALAGLAYGFLRAKDDQEFASLPQRERNLAVYDAFQSHLRKNYFDRKVLNSPEWLARLAEFREKAAGAPDDARLYLDVFYQLQQKFPHSHVKFDVPARPSVKPMNAAPASSPGDSQTADQAATWAAFLSGTGADIVQIRRGEGAADIVGDVRRDSPAERAGIHPGWLVEGSSINATFNRADAKVLFTGTFLKVDAALMRHFERDRQFPIAPGENPEQAMAALNALRAIFEFEQVAMPAIAPFESRKLDEITYVRFDSFNEVKLMDRVFAAIDGATTAGLVVDLRHNAGGRSDQVLRLVSRLIGPDRYIGTVRWGWRISNIRTDKNAVMYEGPMAVLIGPYSGSAAEIAAAAVLDNKRGLLIGRFTSGSVLGSEYYPLPDGGRVMIPAQDYVRSGDRRIEGVGVEPDIWILPTLEDVRAGRDPVLERAIRELGAS